MRNIKAAYGTRLPTVWDKIPTYPDYRTVDEILALLPGWTRVSVYNALNQLDVKMGKLVKKKEGMLVSFARKTDAEPPDGKIASLVPRKALSKLGDESPSQLLERIEERALRLSEEAEKLIEDISQLRPLLITDALTDELRALRALKQSMTIQLEQARTAGIERKSQ